MQRAAIARALVGQPEILLADEPTEIWTSIRVVRFLDLMMKLNTDHQLSIVMVTHDEAVAKLAHRTVRLAEGRLQMLRDAAVGSGGLVAFENGDASGGTSTGSCRRTWSRRIEFLGFPAAS